MEKGEKKQKIQWDEETIAEHDKERGSRQKIDEAPTPFRYQSESDQSECESDAESLARRSLEEGEEEASSPGVAQQRHSKKKKNVLFNSNGNNKICDSWEAVNAKLQYEKHLQDTARSATATAAAGIYLPRNGVNSDSVQRSQFYMSSGSNSNSNIAGGTGSPKVTMAGAGKIMDLQTNFGEMVNSAPAAFSPQFTRKNYRTYGSAGKAGNSNSSGGGTVNDAADESHEVRIAAHSPVPSPVRNATNPSDPSSGEKPPKTVFIKAVRGDMDTTEDQGCASAEEHNGHVAISCGSASGDDEGSGKHSKQFLNKRAGHYNEFKVLQAMRAKLAAEDDEDDDEDA